MRLAVSPSRSALMMGTPPATAASNATITPLFCAAANISLPCNASNALFAVTTCLASAIACRTKSFAGATPPMSSTTISISLPRTTCPGSVVSATSGPARRRALATSRTAAMTTRISRPARRLISLRLRVSKASVPPPTVPNPSNPTFIGFIADRRGETYPVCRELPGEYGLRFQSARNGRGCLPWRRIRRPAMRRLWRL